MVPVQQATIRLNDLTLSDWPKPASLLPALTPSPGEVPFGEIYVSWSTNGLAFAAIGQDYYDLDLMAYRGAFPLSEAYRIEFGLDAGGGQRYFTLYFIPPKTKEKDHPPMAALLCAGSAKAGDADAGCKKVPGAEAVYFGADQPRITAEALLPWRALGIDGPPAGGEIKAEVAATAWHRSRWMSLSGLPPEQGLRRPAIWTRLRLGPVS
jgi:hypothetical protein